MVIAVKHKEVLVLSECYLFKRGVFTDENGVEHYGLQLKVTLDDKRLKELVERINKLNTCAETNRNLVKYNAAHVKDKLILLENIGNGCMLLSEFLEFNHKKITFDEKVSLLLKVARLLKKSYECIDYYGDLRPENIFYCDSTKDVLFINYGIIDILLREIDVNNIRSIRHLNYLAPEQLSVSQQKSDKRAIDSYQFGILVYEILTNDVPFNYSRMMNALSAILTETPYERIMKHPELPSEIAAVILKCLDKDPAKRPSIESIINALEKARKISNDLLKLKRKLQEVYYLILEGDYTAVKRELEPYLTSEDPSQKAIAEFLLGVANSLQKKNHIAIRNFRNALKESLSAVNFAYQNFQFKNKDVFMNLGIAAYKNKNYSFAEKIFAACQSAYPLYMPALRYVALSQIKQGQLDDALINLEKLISLDSKYGKAYLDIAEIHVKKRNIADAIKNVENAISLDDKLSDAWQMLGELYFIQRNYKRALTAFQNAMLGNPNSSLIYELTGKTYLRMGDLRKAKNMLLKALDLDKNNTHAMEYLGDIYAQEHNYKAALEYYQKIIEKGVTSYIVLWKIGLVKYKLKKYQEALQLFLKALKLKETYKTLISIARTYIALEKYKSALTYLETAQTLKPEGYLAMLYKARVLPKLKRTNEALKIINKLLMKRKKDVSLLLLKARILRIHRKNYKEAEKTLLTALKIDPSSTKLKYELGLILYKQTRYKDAQKILSEIKNTNDAEVLRILGLINFKHRKYPEAIKYFSESLQIYRKMQKRNKIYATQYSMAITFFEMKECEKAFEIITKLVKEQKQKKYRYLVFAGRVSAHLKKYDLAIEFLEEALKLHPKSESAAYLLARVFLKLKDIKRAFKVLLPVVTSRKSPSKETLILMADLYYKVKNYSNAVRLLDALCKKNPSEIPLKFKLGKALYKSRDYQRALAVFNEVKKFYKESHKLWKYIGLCYFKQGLLNEAENALNTAVSLGAKMEDLKDIIDVIKKSKEEHEAGNTEKNTPQQNK